MNNNLPIGPYQLNHFIFLGISILCIIGTILIAKYKKIPLKYMIIFMLIVSIISEFVKMIHYVEPSFNEFGIEDGGILQKEALPFHMC